jgi:hypothetical protein
MGEVTGFLTRNRFAFSDSFLGETVDATHAIIHCFPCHQWVMDGKVGLLKPLEPATQATFFWLCFRHNMQDFCF